jgi:glutathione S-transferase
MYTLHIANKNYSSWSLRPWVLMTELAIPFEEKLHVFKGGANWDAFRVFSSSGRVPCLWDGDHRIWDSLSITEYLAEKHPEVWPEERTARAWARSACAEMHSGFSTLRNICGMNCGVRMALNNVPPALAADIRRIDELWCDGLRRFGGPFLAGSRFTAVDAFFTPVAFRIQTYGLSLSDNAMAYANHLLGLPAMADWYKQALNEPWRDAGHEEEMLLYGLVTQDLRHS